MDSHVIALEHPAVDLQRQHYQNQTPHPFQTHFNYATMDDGLFYSRHIYHQQQLETPPSTTTTEDSSSCAGRSSPFDDENQLPTPEEFKAIVDDYLNNLSPKKRDKALVDQHRYYLIQQVLRDPRNTAISTAQFRFWVKKMFQLQLGTVDIICHDNKPVAIKENIYDILVRAHREAHHGGRDKTSALVRRKFSWIPKELVARFVRHCPFCITRRNGGQSPGTMKSSSPRYHYISSGTTPATRHFSFDHPTIKEEQDLSPHYSPQYDRDDDGFLNSDVYHHLGPATSLASIMGFRPSSISSTNSSSSSQNYNNYLSTLAPPQFNVMAQHQNFMFPFANNTTSYCPMGGKGGHACSDQDHSTSAQLFTQQQYDQPSTDLLDHRQDPTFFDHANPLVNFVNSIPDVPFGI